MKTTLIIFSLILAVAIVGCEKTTTKYVTVDVAPAVPQGLYSITADLAVYLFWLPVRESDLAGYKVYRSANDTDFFLIGNTAKNKEDFVDSDVQNGTTYYYAVTAYDLAGNESALSYESVFDTPRPEGTALVLADFNYYPIISGYDFSTYTVLPWNNVNADFYVEYFEGTTDSVFYINVTNGFTDIQDMGYTGSFDDISYAPTLGWSKVGWCELILGHTYIIWTKDNHFAKLRVTNVSEPTSVRFDWGYQTATGNPELARPQHDADFLKREIKGIILK